MAENSYAQLIDDFENGINVLKGETLTEYIKRMGGVDYNAHGGSVGIEILFSPKRKDLQGGGPAGGASAGGNYGGNRNPDQTYGGSIFSGGGGGNNNQNTKVYKPPVIPKDDPKGILNTGSSNPNLLKFLSMASKYNPLNLIFGSPASAEEFDLEKLKEIGAVEKGTVWGHNLTDKGELLDDFTQSAIKMGTTGKKGMNPSLGAPIESITNRIMNMPGGTFKEFQKPENRAVIQSALDQGLLSDQKDFTTQKEFEEYFKKGGRVGLENGGTSNWWDGLTGEAKGIYDSMTAYGASDAEIQAKLQAQNLWSPDGSGGGGGGTGIINQAIDPLFQGNDRPYAGIGVDQTDYSFNPKNYGPGGKLEVNPEALGISFFDSEPGGKKDQGFIESFMSAAVPSRQFSEFKSPGTGGVLTGPAEQGFMEQSIGMGLPKGLTREQLRSMYDNYSTFAGRASNYANARVPGSVGNLINLIPYMGPIKKGAEAFFGPAGDKSMRSKYAVDNVGYGNTGQKDEFGTYLGGKTLLGKTKDYLERMENKVGDLTNFFGGKRKKGGKWVSTNKKGEAFRGIENFADKWENWDDLDEIEQKSLFDQMKNLSGFSAKQLLAYKNRIASEKINRDWLQKEAEKKKAKELADQQAIQEAAKKRTYSLKQLQDSSPNQQGQSYGAARARTSSRVRDDGTIKAYGLKDGGLATMFIRRR